MSNKTIDGVSTVGVAADESGRHEYDFYRTHSGLTYALMDNLPFPLAGEVVEPFAGDLAITKCLTARYPAITTITNDIRPLPGVDLNYDARNPDFWNLVKGSQWVVSNPAYENEIPDDTIPMAYEASNRGVIMLLRLSWLEPAKTRVDFLRKHPPNYLFVISGPRPSFRLNKKGKKSTDSVTVAWFVWDRMATSEGVIVKFVRDWDKPQGAE